MRDDLHLSRYILAEKGTLIPDDWSHSDYPDVAAAIWDCVSAEGLMPLVTTDQKMYATWPRCWSGDALSRLSNHAGSLADFDSAAHRFTSCSYIRLRLKGWSSTDSRRL